MRGAGCRGRISSLHCPHPAPVPQPSSLPPPGCVCWPRWGAIRWCSGPGPDAAQLSEVAELLARPGWTPYYRNGFPPGMTYAAARGPKPPTRCCQGQGHCCARPTTFWASSTAKPFWRRAPPSRRWRCPGWVQPTAAAAGEHNGIPMASASYPRSLTVEDWTALVPPRAAALYTRGCGGGTADGWKQIRGCRAGAAARETRSRFCRRARCE